MRLVIYSTNLLARLYKQPIDAIEVHLPPQGVSEAKTIDPVTPTYGKIAMFHPIFIPAIIICTLDILAFVVLCTVATIACL